MSQLTIYKLSQLIKIEPQELIKKFKMAGIIKQSQEDHISDQEKMQLLAFLKAQKKHPIVEESKYNIKTGSKKVTVEVRKLVQEQPNIPPVSPTEEEKLEEDYRGVEESLNLSMIEEHPIESPIVSDIPNIQHTASIKDIFNKDSMHIADVEEPTLDVPKKSNKLSHDKKIARKTRHYAASIDLLDDLEEEVVLRSPKKLTKSEKKSQASLNKFLKITANLTLSSLAQTLNLPLDTITTTFQKLYTNQPIDTKKILSVEDSILIAEELGISYVIRDKKDAITYDYSRFEACEADPVITIVGHVDHGKTSILDYIRKTKVAQSEKGGITQKIGAYNITINNKNLTFLDTPGHEAFTQMRERGVKNTDITILVIASDDGIKPQTIESINQIKQYNIPVIVALSKIDKPTANPELVKHQLMQYGLVPEDLGGDILCVGVSSITGQGIDDLLNAILLQSEILELKCYKEGPAEGFIVESRMDSKSGCNSTIIVRNGALKVGDILLCGTIYGKVRSIKNQWGQSLQEALPVIPVEITGIDTSQQIGDRFTIVNDIQTAKHITQSLLKAKTMMQQDQPLISVQEMLEALSHEQEQYNLILKAESTGSALALKQLINTTSLPFHITQESIGIISLSDVELAYAAKASIVGFNVSVNKEAQQKADRIGIKIICSNIIYKLLDNLMLIYKKPLEEDQVNDILGKAEVIAVFGSSSFKAIAGCKITEGRIKILKTARVLRHEKYIYTGQIKSLKHLKENIIEARGVGYECGIGMSGYEPKIGDILEILA